MQLELTVDKKALTEAAKMTRRWHYWPLVVWQSAYPFLLLAILIWGALFNLISSQGSLQRAALCGIVAAGLISLWAWQYRRNSNKTDNYLSTVNPVRFSIQSNGISITEGTGTSLSTPWREFSSFRMQTWGISNCVTLDVMRNSVLPS